MKKIIVTGLSTLSMLALVAAPRALAQEVSSILPERPATTATISNIARNDRLTVTNPQAFSVSFRSSNSYTLYLELAEPVVNGGGDILIPAGATVEATLTLTEAGAQIVAEYIIYRSMAVEINAHSHTLPVQERVIRSVDEKFGDALPYARLLGNGVGTLVTDDPNTGELLGVVVSTLVTSLFVQPDVERGTHVAQQNFYLTLPERIVVPFEKLAVFDEEIEQSAVNEVAELPSVSASAGDLQ